ncbi:MAG: ABC transporter ATP-binding protein [Sulfurifustaceae bacterium]
MMQLSGVSRHFGGVRAVDALDLRVEPGQIFGLIGPNGSGKSTTLHLISGLLPLTAGRIDLGGRDIGRLPAHERAACGIARTFQEIRLFGQLTVSQNLRTACEIGLDRAENKPARRRRRSGASRVDIESALKLWGLADKRDRLAADLSFAEQRRLELARALAMRPRLLLLDEPAAGMDTDEIDQLRERLLWLRGRGIGILLVEHAMALVLSVCDRIAVLNFGRKIAEGTPAELGADAEVRAVYLGAAKQ